MFLSNMKKNLILFSILVALLAAAYFVYQKGGKSTLSDKPLSDFTIEDTLSVNKIVITDHIGNIAKIERQQGMGLWKLNDKYFARKDAVDLILKTMKMIRVRGNVSEKARDNMMKILITAGKRVEIYQGGNQPSKIYYIGSPTPDHTGTIMLLEIPEVGRSQEPYITHMEGFTGFLSTRFFTSELEWRYTGIFEYPALDFSEVKIINHLIPASSISVIYTGGNEIRIMAGYDHATNQFSNTVQNFDTLKVKDLLLLFKKVHIESFNTLLKPEAEDSMRNIMPAYTVQIKEKNGGTKSVDLYLKRAANVAYDEDGNLAPWDKEHLWARTDANEFALAQLYTFEPLLRPLDYYTSTSN